MGALLLFLSGHFVSHDVQAFVYLGKKQPGNYDIYVTEDCSLFNKIESWHMKKQMNYVL